MRKQFKNPRFYLKLAVDSVLFAVAHLIAYLFRFEFFIDQTRLWQITMVLPWLIPLKIIVFYRLGLYHGMWRYTSIRDFWLLAIGTTMTTLIPIAAVFLLYRDANFSRAVFLMDGGLTFMLAGLHRLLVRSYYMTQARTGNGRAEPAAARPPRNVLIVGAGDAGEKILREINENEQIHYRVVGFVDDDPLKQGRSIHGVTILGKVATIPSLAVRHDVEEILIAAPSATGDQMRRIVEICKGCHVTYKTLPGIGEIIDGRVSVKILRDISYEDLLGRPPVHLDVTGIRSYLAGRTILVTGCGGSIGSELCRQLVRFEPGLIVLVDASEANLFQIQMEMENELDFRRYEPVLGQVQDEALMRSVFETYKPRVVFHAAAYKHVPMLERNPWEAVFNNIQGSRTVMETAAAFGVERFVLVSTDKAVRPTNVMGASKRITELILQSLQGSETRFLSVRFGNVVGSSGSVIPLFRRQIEHGGPVTVTDPEVTRFFMTIPEAAQLIIQAGAMGEGGEIYILKMGTPVRIIDMARDLIRLSGREPDRDVRIVFTGLREGEKLHEELITEGEGIVPTGHDKILVLRADPDPERESDPGAFRRRLYREIERLCDAASRHDAPEIKRLLHDIVPEYAPQDSRSVL
ncbi:MAG: polysaccharide biosynthesis protein [Deltaproteobacteria bacterium HGW-Deltaproteobacteria-19]|jgi:FlaA1/EpsC-like NDP-sugar epimerase|nr:MAG: polysaccharide biosynthesis protein [Deltaproteobacteria bacterium HGW-Deltaproteobacteria-19]